MVSQPDRGSPRGRSRRSVGTTPPWRGPITTGLRSFRDERPEIEAVSVT